MRVNHVNILDHKYIISQTVDHSLNQESDFGKDMKIVHKQSD